MEIISNKGNNNNSTNYIDSTIQNTQSNTLNNAINHVNLIEKMIGLYHNIQHILLINLNDVFKKNNLLLLLQDQLVNDTISLLKHHMLDFNFLLQKDITQDNNKQVLFTEENNLYIKLTKQLDQYVNDNLILDYSMKDFEKGINEEDSQLPKATNSTISTITSNSISSDNKTVKSKKGCFKQKKDHEVDKLSRFIQIIGQKEHNDVFLEMGCGKSYLTDSLLLNNENSLYIGIDMKENLIANSTKQNITKENIIVLSSMITPSNFNTFFNEKICPMIQTKNKQLDHILLFGLHSCGNLTSDTLKFFVRYPNFTTLAIVGCCLNLLKEYVSPEAKQSEIFQSYYKGIGYDSKGNFLEQTLQYDNNEDQIGYPLSKHILLNHKDMFLSRTIRNSSMQKSTDTHDVNSLSCRKIYYRTLLQAFLEEYIPELSSSYGFKRVDLNEKDTFKEYLLKILETFEKNKNEAIIAQVKYIKENQETIIPSFLSKYTQADQYLWSLYMIRLRFAKLVEYIIALDRAIYLNENGISNVQLIKIFDENVSIRNILIYASKL